MSAEPIELPRPTLAEQMPTYADLLSLVDRLMRDCEHIEARMEDLMQDKERALYQLHLMRGNGILDLNKLERAIKGDQR